MILPPAPSSSNPRIDLGLLQELFDRLQDGLLIVNGENRILSANESAARLLAENVVSLAGLRVNSLSDGPILESLLADIRSGTFPGTIEQELQAAGGPCQIVGLPLTAAGGPPPVLLVLRNLAPLRHLERASEEYVTNVSHELKTPLTLILGFTETLLSHPDMDAAFRERSLRTIERHTQRILRIIDDLLRLAWLKSENYFLGIPRPLIPVATVVAQAVDFCQEWTHAAGVNVITEVPENLQWHLNPGLVEEALVNLIRNAILYALVGPVVIRARTTENGHLELAVIDRGPGLQPEDAARIFDRFYRVDKSRSRSSGGSGLGLPIVQQIVLAHHGTARVETAPGKGCTFLLDFPPGPAEPSPSAKIDVNPPPGDTPPTSDAPSPPK